MKIRLLGTGTSYPDSERVQSGILIEQGERRVLFDIGSGVLHRLTQTGVNLDTINSIFISHFHIDHCSDFLAFCQSVWLSGSKRSIDVYGPPFLNEWINSLHEQTFPYLREKVIIRPHILEKNKDVVLDDLLISNIPAVHGTMESRAFRVQANGKTVIFSSDTAPFQDFNSFSQNATVLIHECNWLDGLHPSGVHTSPSELANIVEETRPANVILTHLSPEVVEREKDVVETIKGNHEISVCLGRDLMLLEI
jgi:ribonuclease BN (tRNA processing enzyme)